MPSIFDQAVQYTLLNEGGYSDVPQDSGGPTNFGITQEDLANWRGQAVTASDVKNMTVDEAKAIYKSNYWEPYSLKYLSSAVIATAIFDTGVLYGPGNACRYSQRAANNCGSFLDVDGMMGVLTLKSLNALDQTRFIYAFRTQIVSRIDGIIGGDPSQEIFRAGWMNRANRLLTLIGEKV